MREYTEADMKFDGDPLMQEEDYVEGLVGYNIDVQYGVKIQPDSVHARVSVLEPPEIPPLEMTQHCFQLYTDLLPALYCFLNRGRVSMKLIHGIYHDAWAKCNETN